MLPFKEGSDSVPMPLSLGRVCHNGHSGTRSWLLEALALPSFRSRLIQHCTEEKISKGKPQSSIEWKTRTC